MTSRRSRSRNDAAGTARAADRYRIYDAVIVSVVFGEPTDGWTDGRRWK